MIQKAKSAWDLITKREIREIAAPISKEGVHLNRGENYATRDSPQGRRPEIFTPSTTVIYGGWAEWKLEVPEYIRKDLIDMTLRIETVRTHGMLHSPIKHSPNNGISSSASIFVNGKLVDKLHLVKPHPHGEDYGVDSRRPFPIFRYIDRNENIQTVKIEMDKNVFWDIDRVTFEPIILRKEWKPVATMIMGAIISAIIGGIVSLILKCFI